MAKKIDVATEQGWPKVLDAEGAAQYLNEVHCVPASKKRLSTWRSARMGPHPIYFGSRPMYRRDELDKFATTEAFSEQSPHANAARRRRAAGLPAPAGIGRPRKKDRQRRAKTAAAGERPSPSTAAE
jgi:hypothetical protein